MAVADMQFRDLAVEFAGSVELECEDEVAAFEGFGVADGEDREGVVVGNFDVGLCRGGDCGTGSGELEGFAGVACGERTRTSHKLAGQRTFSGPLQRLLPRAFPRAAKGFVEGHRLRSDDGCLDRQPSAGGRLAEPLAALRGDSLVEIDIRELRLPLDRSGPGYAPTTTRDQAS